MRKQHSCQSTDCKENSLTGFSLPRAPSATVSTCSAPSNSSSLAVAARPAVPSGGTGCSTCSKHVPRPELQQVSPAVGGHTILRYSSGCTECLALCGLHLTLSLLT